MQQLIDSFQDLLKMGKIHTSNEYLKKILKKFVFIYYDNIIESLI